MLSTLRFAWQCLRMRRPQYFEPEKLAALRAERLRQVVGQAMTQAPYFRARYRGIDLDHLDLTRLPTTTKAELMEHFDNAVTDPAIRRVDLEKFVQVPENRTRLFLDRYVACHTSGSQGQPLLLVQKPEDIELLFALQASRGSAFSRSTVGEVLRRLREPARLAIIGLSPGYHPSSAAWAHYPEGARALVHAEFFLATDGGLLRALNDYQPHVLIGYATILDNLAVASADLKLAPTLRQVVNNSENLTDKARQRLEQAFNVPVLDNYATGECMFLAQGCPAGPGAHVNADWAILEVVDEDNQPVPAGSPGHKVLITNLANSVQPIIRYEVGDRVVMSEQPCACGSRLPRIARVEGRTADAFWVGLPGRYRQITTHIFKNGADFLHGLREWQAVQEERNRIHVRLLPLPGKELNLDEARQRFLHLLKQVGLDFVDVRVSQVANLEPDPRTRKLKRVVSRVGAPRQDELLVTTTTA